jgi:hypothetical protein
MPRPRVAHRSGDTDPTETFAAKFCCDAQPATTYFSAAPAPPLVMLLMHATPAKQWDIQNGENLPSVARRGLAARFIGSQ